MSGDIVVSGPVVAIQLLGVTTRVPEGAQDHVAYFRSIETAEVYWILGALADELKRRGMIADRGRH